MRRIFAAYRISLIGLLCLLCLDLSVQAQTKQLLEYRYDDAGNVISISRFDRVEPPEITDLIPDFILKGQMITVTAIGSFLKHVQVSTEVTGLSVLNTQSMSDQTVRVTLYADNTTALGPALLTFSTAFGNTQAAIDITEKLANVTILPNPIILAPDEQPITVRLVADSAPVSDQMYEIQSQDLELAKVNSDSLILNAGQNVADIGISGQAVGHTLLFIRHTVSSKGLTVPIVITEDQLPAGVYRVDARLVGISVYIEQDYNYESVFAAQPVGASAYVQQGLSS